MGDSNVAFDAETARKAMNACADLTSRFLAVKNALNNVTEVKSFSSLKSGGKWADGYQSLGRQFGGVLDTHIKVVASMADAFRTAIREFENSEDESIRQIKGTLDEISNTKMPDKGELYGKPDVVDWHRIPGRPGYDPPKQQDLPTDGPTPAIKTYFPSFGSVALPSDTPVVTIKGPHQLFGYDGDFKPNSDDSRIVSPENPYHMTWEQLYALRESIHPMDVVNYASKWGQLRDEIVEASGKFSAVVSPSGFWDTWSHGSGTAAANAARNYVTTVGDLTAKLTSIENNLYTDANWLKAAYDALPSTPAPPEPTQIKTVVMDKNGKVDNSVPATTVYHNPNDKLLSSSYGTRDDAIGAETQPYQEKCEKTYVAGIEAYNGTLLKFPDLAPPADITPPPPVVVTDPNAGKQPALTNTGGASPSTPGTPGTPTDANPTDAKPTDTNPVNTNPNATTPNNTTTTKDNSLSTIVSAVEKVAEEGVSLVESLASTGATALQQGITSLSSLLTSQQTTKTTTTTDEQQLKEQLEQEKAALTNLGGSPKDTGGGVPSSPGGTPTTTTPKVTESRLFPRSVVATNDQAKEEVVTASRAGLATTSASATSSSTGSSGMPMGAGGAQGAGQGGKEYKRPDYLKSGENLEDVFEGAPAAVLPVAEK